MAGGSTRFKIPSYGPVAWTLIFEVDKNSPFIILLERIGAFSSERMPYPRLFRKGPERICFLMHGIFILR